jgi:hypothetical protein
VSRDVLRQVRLIELRTRGLVTSIFGGEYQSVFRGQGMEFSEVREYEPGDDVRNIDWNVTARTGQPYVKKHVEERELTVLLLVVDLSGSSSSARAAGSRRSWPPSWRPCSRCPPSATTTASACSSSPIVIEHVVPPRKGGATCSG